MTFWVGIKPRDRHSKASSEGPIETQVAQPAQIPNIESSPILAPNSKGQYQYLAPDTAGSADLQFVVGHMLTNHQGHSQSDMKTAEMVQSDSAISGSTNDRFAARPLRSSSKWMSAGSLLRIRLPGHTGQML